MDTRKYIIYLYLSILVKPGSLKEILPKEWDWKKVFPDLGSLPQFGTALFTISNIPSLDLGTSGNTKVEMQYRNEWSAETVLESVLDVDTVQYFCVVVLDDCIRLEYDNGTVLLEENDFVDYRYLRRIGLSNLGIAYWKIRSVPYRFPGKKI